MDIRTEFNNLLLKMEDSESKTELLGAFENVSKAFDASKTRADGLGTKYDTQLTRETDLTKALGLEKDFTIDNVTDLLSSLSKNKSDEVETALGKAKESSDAELSAVRDLLKGLETERDTLTYTNESLNFKNIIRDNKMLDGFDVADPQTEKYVLSLIKDMVLVKDGMPYVKDSNGGILNDIKTGEPKAISSISEHIKSTINPKYLSVQTSGNGSGMSPNQSGQTTQSKMTLTEQHAQNSASAGFN